MMGSVIPYETMCCLAMKMAEEEELLENNKIEDNGEKSSTIFLSM